MTDMDVDAAFAELINESEMAGIEAAVEGPPTAAPAKAAMVPDAPKSGGAIKPSFAGKKRQLTVPAAAASKKPCPAELSKGSSATALINEAATTKPESPKLPASAASSPLKSHEPTTMQEPEPEQQQQQPTGQSSGDAGEPEVQSPLKRAPTETDDAGAGDDSMLCTTEEEAKPTEEEAKPAVAAPKRKVLKVKPKTGAQDPTASTQTITKTASKPSTSKAKATADAGASKAKLPRAQSAYFFFCNAKRAAVKEAEPGLSFPEVGKKLGEMWKELSDEDKKTYTDQAIADKERVAQELAAMDESERAALQQAAKDQRASKKDKQAGGDKGSAKNGAAEKAAKKAAKAEAAAQKKAEKAAQTKKESAAFKYYHSIHFVTVKAENPGMESLELNTKVAHNWQALQQEERDEYTKQAEDVAAANAVKAAASLAPKKGKGKRGKKAAAGDATDNEDQEGAEAAGGGGSSSRRRAAAAAEQDEDDDESDREDVDWEAHPAGGVFAHAPGAFLVSRRGVMLTEYGKVDSVKAKSRLLHGAASSEEQLPVSQQQVEEYEAFCQRFWAAVKGRMDTDCILDMDELEEGSPLEACFVLAKLQEKGQLLDPGTKNTTSKLDPVRKLPVMRLSMCVQRLLDLKQQEHSETKAVLKDLVEAMQGAGSIEALRESSAAVAAAAAAAGVLEG